MELIWIKENWHRFVKYDYSWKREEIHEDTIWFTTVEFTEEQKEEIRNATLDKLEIILSKYI